MAEPAPRTNRALLLKLAVLAAGLLIVAALVARGLDWKGLIAPGLDLIRHAGPSVFFTAMAVLPAVGMPLSFFSLTAGSVFGPQLGMGPVILFSLTAVTVNMALSYFLACRALRPLLERLIVWLGYKLPHISTDDATDLIVLLRVTGLPFPVQNYLLGLAEVPFRKFLPVSCLVIWPSTVAFILFGDALLQGKGQGALIAISLLVALAAATHLARKHYGKKKQP